MTSRTLSIGFFGVFGRSAELRALDRELRAVDLHPKLVPEAVKLTAARLLMEQARGNDPTTESYRKAAKLLAYCMVGADAYAGANGEEQVASVERRIEAALAAGDSLDAKLVLLTLHAKVIQPSVIEFFQLKSGDD